MLYLTSTTITSVDLAHYGVSRAKDWGSVDCGTMYTKESFDKTKMELKRTSFLSK